MSDQKCAHVQESTQRVQSRRERPFDLAVEPCGIDVGQISLSERGSVPSGAMGVETFLSYP